MVNSAEINRLGVVRLVVVAYVVVVLATVVALAVLSAAEPQLATSEAWGHAVIVGVLAMVLPLRLRAARRGSAAGIRAIAVIGCVLLVVNLVEATLPGVFPSWMRVEMLVIAALMLALVGTTVRALRSR